jgi:outer membrane protein insertion porin family
MNSNQFVKLTNDTRLYRQIGMLRFASGLKLGWVRPFGMSASVPLQDRFFAGGSRSVRGFKDNFLLTRIDSIMHAQSGTVLATANLLEIRFPLFWRINGAVFADAGILRNRGDDENRRSIMKEIRWTTGPGLRVNTPLAVLRFDLGFKLDRRTGEPLTQWHLDVGQSF